MGAAQGRENEGGFTLIELVIVIAIIGLLAAVAIPRFIDLRTEAARAGRDGVIGGVRAGIMVRVSENLNSGTTPVIPAALDALAAGTTCSTTSPCFASVLTDGVADGRWEKVAVPGGCPAGADSAYTFTPPAGAGSATTSCYENSTGSLGQI